jgi:hypothetical protein
MLNRTMFLILMLIFLIRNVQGFLVCVFLRWFFGKHCAQSWDDHQFLLELELRVHDHLFGIQVNPDLPVQVIRLSSQVEKTNPVLPPIISGGRGQGLPCHLLLLTTCVLVLLFVCLMMIVF